MRNNGDDHQNRPRRQGLTEAEREAVRQRCAERAELRNAASEANFVRALAAGRALKERGLQPVSGARSRLARVRRIEQARAAPRSPIEIAYGSLEAFEAEVTAGIEAGKYDRSDMPMVLACIRRWHTEGALGAWTRQQVW